MVIAALMLAGCQGPAALRRAQDLYNRGVEIENAGTVERWNMQVDPERAPVLPASPDSSRGYYAACLDVLDGLSEPKLAQDRLVSTARLLRALCLWRLDRYKEARDAANRAEEASTAEGEPRDRIMARALPGMIKIDEARDLAAEASGMSGDERVEAAGAIRAMLLTGDRSATSMLGAARGLDGISDALTISLIWYELDAYHEWWKAKDALLREDLAREKKHEIDALLDEMEQIDGGRAIADNLRTLLPDADPPGG
ncbi:MAG: hypothetical protein CMJ18_21420 [Phycisphaeraceae bacterium]|nr:hypothetical protein [Phycisphaeraceae bacterium]